MEQKLKIGLFGLLSGFITLLLSIGIPVFGFFFFPGLIFGIFMGFQYKSWKHRLTIISFSTIAYVVAALALPMVFDGDSLMSFKEAYVWCGVAGGIILGLGFKVLNLVLARDVFVLGLLSATILFFIPLNTEGPFSSTIPDIRLLFPIWQTMIAFYLAFVMKSNDEVKTI